MPRHPQTPLEPTPTVRRRKSRTSKRSRSRAPRGMVPGNTAVTSETNWFDTADMALSGHIRGLIVASALDRNITPAQQKARLGTLGAFNV